jgi:hypothetical protein
MGSVNGRGQRLDDGQRGLGIRIAAHHEGDERGAALLPDRLEAAVDAG